MGQLLVERDLGRSVMKRNYAIGPTRLSLFRHGNHGTVNPSTVKKTPMNVG